MLSLARQFTLICRSSIWDLHQGVSMGKTCSAVLHGEGDGLAPWLQYLLSKPFVPQLLFLKRHNLHNIANNNYLHIVFLRSLTLALRGWLRKKWRAMLQHVGTEHQKSCSTGCTTTKQVAMYFYIEVVEELQVLKICPIYSTFFNMCIEFQPTRY